MHFYVMILVVLTSRISIKTPPAKEKIELNSVI
jgi:hypothetical protein